MARRSSGSSVWCWPTARKCGSTASKGGRKAIVAIGGGKLTATGTAAIDREIVRLAGRKHPRVLFLPTASSDRESYARRFVRHFGGLRKCRTEVLRLVDEPPSQQEIEPRIFSADIIYVGGGNTLAMMRLWRRLGVDRLLRAAYEKGIVLAGISAGAICWFDAGHSDSMSFYDPRNWEYIRVKGLGLVRGIHCPHYNGRTRGVPRRKDFQEMIGKIGGIGIAIENNCAIEFMDGRLYRVIGSKANARAYRVRKNRGAVTAEEIPRQDGWARIEGLYEFATANSRQIRRRQDRRRHGGWQAKACPTGVGAGEGGRAGDADRRRSTSERPGSNRP